MENAIGKIVIKLIRYVFTLCVLIISSPIIALILVIKKKK